MRGKNLYRAMGEIDDKYIRSAKKMMEIKEPNKAVSGVFSVLKYAGAFALVAAVVLAIWIPLRFFHHDPDPAQSGTATEQNTDPADCNRYNCFICGDQVVLGIKSLVSSYTSDEKTGELHIYDGFGYPSELIATDEPPTLYYKPGDAVSFIPEPGAEPTEMILRSGSESFFGGALATEPFPGPFTQIYAYLDENPGQYYLLAEYTLKSAEETGKYICGVRLIYESAPESTEAVTTEIPETTEAVTTEIPEENPDDETVMIREAVSALNELYQAVLYGSIDFYKEDLINKIDFTAKDYTQTVKYDYDTAGREEHQGRYECAEEDFYAYFEKYMTSDLVRSFVKSHAYAIDYVENVDIHAPMCLYDGKISVTGYLGYQSPSSINADSVRLISQNGNTATLGVEFKYGHGMTSTPIELELEVIEDKNGIRITGGELIEKTLWPTCFGITGEIINTYMIMREGVFLENIGIYYKIYNSYNELPNELKKEIEPDARFPLIVKDRVMPDSWTERWCTEEIGSALFDDTNDMYDGKYIYPDKAPGRVEQAFFGSPKIKDSAHKTTGSEVLAAMKMTNSNKNGFEFSLDFKVDGTVKAYTFEYTVENGNVTLTGGTFVTELIMKTPEQEPDEETVMIREAVSALDELYRAVRYGFIDRTEFSERVALTAIDYKVNVQYGERIHEESVRRYECSEEEFYAYFEKYVSRDIIETFIRDNAIYAVPGEGIPDPAANDEDRALVMPIYVYDGKISISDMLGPQYVSSVTANSARLIEQNGNKATIGVLFHYSHAAMGTDIEMELQIVKDGNGIRITGGEMIDKAFTKAQDEMLAAAKTFVAYMNLHEGDRTFYSSLDYVRVYNYYADLTEAYKERFGKDDLPIIEAHLFTLDGECLLDRVMSKKIREELIKTNAVYDGEFIHPENAPGRVEAAFIGGPKVRHDEYDSVYIPAEFMAEAKIVKSGKNGSTFSVDIKVDGKVRSYTFEVTYDNGTPKVTGGTFVTEIIFGK